MLDSVVARPAVPPVDEVRSAVERYRDAVDRHDIDAAVAAFTDDGLIDCTPAPDGERYEGAVEIRALFRQLFDSTDERTFETEELIIAGDRAVVRWCHRWVDGSGRPGHVRSSASATGRSRKSSPTSRAESVTARRTGRTFRRPIGNPAPGAGTVGDRHLSARGLPNPYGALRPGSPPEAPECST